MKTRFALFVAVLVCVSQPLAAQTVTLEWDHMPLPPMDDGGSVFVDTVRSYAIEHVPSGPIIVPLTACVSNICRWSIPLDAEIAQQRAAIPFGASPALLFRVWGLGTFTWFVGEARYPVNGDAASLRRPSGVVPLR